MEGLDEKIHGEEGVVKWEEGMYLITDQRN